MKRTEAATLHRNLALAGLYLLLSLIVNLVFCFHASPLWHGYMGDQAMFSIIGDNWAHGLLPYVDTWDSKGPIIFFVNMLGHLLAPGEYGIFILQVLNLAGALLISHAYMRRWCSLRLELLVQMLFVMSYVVVSSGGNQVGDSTQLLGIWAVMAGYDWTRKMEHGSLAHPWGSATVYGMFTAACLLSRLTDCLAVLSFAGIVALTLVYHKMWRNLWANILGFAMGFAMVFVPFAAYFAWHGAFGEMWYATFTYNMEYTVQSSAEPQPSMMQTLHSASYFVCLLLPLVVGFLAMIDGQRRRTALAWALAVVPALLWIANSYTYANYAISFLPVLIVATLELAEHARQHQAAKWTLGLTAGFITVCSIYQTCILRKLSIVDKAALQGLALTRDIPTTETLAAYNVDATYYLYSHRRPCYRFFTVQDWAILNGSSLRPKVRECFKSGKAKWVLVREYENSEIKGLLDKDYTAYRQSPETSLTLFKRK